MNVISISLIIKFLMISKIEAVYRCDRTPEKPIRSKNSEEIDKYIIEIAGDPESYIPGETYTVTLKYNPMLEGIHMFKDFMLSLETENYHTESESLHKVGYLKLSEDMLSTFSRKCENTILQTSSVPKSSIKVYWVAPSTGNGCVAFRATVVETKENWYSDDGLLTKILCEEESENEDIQPPVLDECSACDEAKYELVFEGLWTRNTHPKDYPSNIWYTKFGDIVGASHTNGHSFWEYGGTASENMKALGEKGDTTGLERELKDNMGESVRTIIKANGLRYPNITGKTFTFFRVDRNNHLVSIVTKITPSPDWVVGVSSFELCLSDGTWTLQRILNLYPWDIGTDDGLTYNSINEASETQDTIKRMETDDPKSPFYDADGKEIKPFAKLYLNRLKTYKKECENAETTSAAPEDVTTEEGQTKECSTTAWSDWSTCSEKCGKGFMFRKRDLLYPENEDICPDGLVQQKECVGKKCKQASNNQNLLAADDSKCEFNEWGEWSSCSVPCGQGTTTRDKTFKNPEFAAQCENNDPSFYQENGDCKGDEIDCPDDVVNEESNCSKTVWGPWSSCSVSCGTGIKTRLRMAKNEDDQEEITESECKNMEEVKCYHKFCNENEGTTMSSFGEISSLNQVTTDNIVSEPFGLVANCKVSNWSVWGPCELNDGKCGKGYRTQHRQIMQHAINGGKPCPIKLMKKKRCYVRCHTAKDNDVTTTASSTEKEDMVTPTETIETTTEESVDCIMSSWSQWSPCSLICGGSAVQQRTRSIVRMQRKNGKPCGPRLDQRSCPLPLACSDKNEFP